MEYWKIYENNQPLEAVFVSRQDATAALRTIVANHVHSGELFGRRVEQVLPQLPVKRTAQIRYIYDDGKIEKRTFFIRSLSLTPK